MKNKKKDAVLRPNNSVGLLKGGWLEVRDGVKILHLNGSNYQMGYQLGFLLKDQYLKNRRAWFNFLEKMGISYDDLVFIWNELKDLIPIEYKNEMQGRADAVNLTFLEVAVIDMLYSAVTCVGMAAWGVATVDGRIYHLRSADGGLGLKDPVSEEYACKDQFLIVRKPDNGYASVVIGLSIQVSAEGGVNEKGIGIGYTTVYKPDTTIHGIPEGIRQRMVLDHAENAEDALNIISSNRTTCYTNIISDGKKNNAYVVEQSANYSYYGTWNDTIESKYPSWIIDHIIRRGNFFLNPTSAGLKDDVYKKSNFIRWLLSLFGLEKEYTYFIMITHYKLLSKAIEKQWGKLDLNGTMEMLRSVYQGKNSGFYSLVQRLGGQYSQVWHQWVICPETGDILVSFADGKKSAYKNPVHHFNMYDLINAQSP